MRNGYQNALHKKIYFQLKNKKNLSSSKKCKLLLVMMWGDSLFTSGDELRCVTGNVALDYSAHTH